MSKKFLIVGIVLFFSAIASSAYAQTASDTSRLKAQEDFLLQKRENLSRLREEARTMMQSKRDEFRSRLQSIKDQGKKTAVERIDAKITNINKKHTDRFLTVLDKLQEILNKADTAAIGTVTLSNIENAQSIINLAKESVEIQSIKIYSPEITDENSLRISVGNTVRQFRQDLLSVHKYVIDAKQAVRALKI